MITAAEAFIVNFMSWTTTVIKLKKKQKQGHTNFDCVRIFISKEFVWEEFEIQTCGTSKQPVDINWIYVCADDSLAKVQILTVAIKL